MSSASKMRDQSERNRINRAKIDPSGFINSLALDMACGRLVYNCWSCYSECSGRPTREICRRLVKKELLDSAERERRMLLESE